MAPVIFRGLATSSVNINDALQRLFGTSGTIVGEDVTLSDQQIDSMIEADALYLHPQIPLDEGNEANIANQLYAQIPNDLKQYQPAPPSSIKVAEGYGSLTEVDRALSILAIAPEIEVRSVLQHEIIPLMMKKFGAQFVTGVSVDASGQQGWISFTKIAMLAQRYAPNDVTQRMKNRALEGIMPFSISIQSFLDALTRFSPLLFTLPVARMGCSWHFQASAMWAFPSSVTNGLVSEFMSNMSPLAKGTHFLGLHGLRGMTEKNIWSYLRFCVASLNRLMRFLNDPRSFALPDGNVDLLKKVQAYSAVHLLFADLLASNFSSVAHNRISYAMSALDKIANLRVQLGTHPSYAEEVAMGELISVSQGEELRRLLTACMRAMNYDDLAERFGTVVDRCYVDVHEHLSTQSSQAANSETARLSRIRWQRNLRHGAFLKRNQFEALFFDSDGTIPDTIGSLPFLLALGIAADPKRFLNFRPLVTV